VFLNAMTVASALIALKGINRFNSLNLGVKTLRNAAIFYYGKVRYGRIYLLWSTLFGHDSK